MAKIAHFGGKFKVQKQRKKNLEHSLECNDGF